MHPTHQQQNTKGILKVITIIHFAMCASIIICGTIFMFISENTQINFIDIADKFFFMIPAFAIGGAVVSNYLFQKKLKEVKEQSTLKEKLSHYQSAKIIQYALIEAPAFFSLVVFLITTNQFYLIIAGALLGYLVALRPVKARIKEALDLNAEQDKAFRDLFK